MSATKLSSQNVDQAAFDAAFPSVVKLDGVMIARGGRILFRNVNFTLKHGSIVQLRGANGTGKTSLLRAIAGVLPVAGGTLTRSGGEAAFLPADDALWHGQARVRAALGDWARVLDCAPPAVDDALAQTGLVGLAQRPLAVLSMGQKRRLSWARVLLRRAPLWLLDEPLNSLDRDGISCVCNLLRAHVAQGGAAVVACHEDITALMPDVPVDGVLLDGDA